VLDTKADVSSLGARVNPLQAALNDLRATVRGKEIKIDLSADVLFNFDKADLRREAGPALEKAVDVLRAHPKTAVTIDGHTDTKGNDKYNQALSVRRAQSVTRWLSDARLDVKMSARGWGKSKPVAPDAKARRFGRPRRAAEESTRGDHRSNAVTE
jgi:outer membrane protein OmpA-like peptidoglycan-associated protein